jgi:hypothetical protein
MRLFLCGLILVTCAFFVSCTSPRLEWALRDNPVGIPFSPKNVFSVDTLPQGIQRVLFMPVNCEHVSVQEFARLKEVFLSELRRSERFSVVTADSMRQLTKSSKDALLDLKTLLALKDEYDVQAILELQLTHYRPYKPQLIGVNARLFTVDSVKPEVLWALDSLFDAGQDSVALGARMHAQKYKQQVFPLASSYTNLNVPRRFAAYVAFTIFRTLPEI